MDKVLLKLEEAFSRDDFKKKKSSALSLSRGTGSRVLYLVRRNCLSKKPPVSTDSFCWLLLKNSPAEF